MILKILILSVLASQYTDYLDIEVNLSKFDKFNYYFNIFSSWFFGLSWVFIFIFPSFPNVFDLAYQNYIGLSIVFILFPILVISMFKDVLAYKSAIKIQQYLKAQIKEK